MAGTVLSGSGVGHNRIRVDCDGINNVFNVVHNLGTRLLIVQVWDEATYELVYVDVVSTDNDTIQITFTEIPDASKFYLVHIISKMDSF
jgi:hypothetical protein